MSRVCILMIKEGIVILYHVFSQIVSVVILFSIVLL
jgi:hypothetical protein